MKYAFSVIAICAILFTGCKEIKELPGSYEVVEVNGQDISGQGVTLNIKMNDYGNRIYGNNGCNEYGGSITTDEEGKVTLGQLLSTKMYCQEKAQLETKFMTQLNKVDQYRISDDLLLLLDQNGNIIIKSKKLDE